MELPSDSSLWRHRVCVWRTFNIQIKPGHSRAETQKSNSGRAAALNSKFHTCHPKGINFRLDYFHHYHRHHVQRPRMAPLARESLRAQLQLSLLTMSNGFILCRKIIRTWWTVCRRDPFSQGSLWVFPFTLPMSSSLINIPCIRGTSVTSTRTSILVSPMQRYCVTWTDVPFKSHLINVAFIISLDYRYQWLAQWYPDCDPQAQGVVTPSAFGTARHSHPCKLEQPPCEWYRCKPRQEGIQAWPKTRKSSSPTSSITFSTSYFFLLPSFFLFTSRRHRAYWTASTLEPTLPPSSEGRNDRLGVDKNARTTQPPVWNDQTSCWWWFAPRRYRTSSFTLPWRWPTLRRPQFFDFYDCFSLLFTLFLSS